MTDAQVAAILAAIAELRAQQTRNTRLLAHLIAGLRVREEAE